jgi:cobyrinic acid a,c-diamide synthase
LRRPPAVVIAAPRSGDGKTTVALGIMAALRRRGLQVQGFKVGPDYLDTGYQHFATGQPGRNLDLWMMGREAVQEAVASQTGVADMVVIEGVMGLFDGHRDGVTPTSTADIAALLGVPVVLVVDASRTAASVGALALGFRTYDDRVDVPGVILNRWGSHRDLGAVAAALDRAGVELLGLVPPAPEVVLPTRHLGLVVAGELGNEVEVVMGRLAELVEAHVDLDRLLEVAREGCSSGLCPPDLCSSDPCSSSSKGERVDGTTASAFSPAQRPEASGLRIAVALDDAFAFYYQDNLRALERAGATLIPFSPLTAEALPECEGLYLGGGFPELHAGTLAANAGLIESIHTAIADGLPTYAECGGLLYLSETLADLESATYRLVGAVPARATVYGRLQSVGYREGVLAADCLLGRAGDVLRGHEFRYSRCIIDRSRFHGCSPAYMVEGCPEGFVSGDLFASCIHLHFAGRPRAVDHWLARCAVYGESRPGGLPIQRSKERG